MSIQRVSRMSAAGDGWRTGDAGTQFGALCYRMQGSGPEILLVTSRGSGRWIVPKGWPVAGESAAGSALVEAYEEAGVIGVVHPVCLGIYAWTKAEPRVVALYPVRVKRLLGKYPEAGQRKRKWVKPARAAAMVDLPDLGALILRFDPVALRL